MASTDPKALDDPNDQPEPITCPICRESYLWVWDEEEWMPDTEWWGWGPHDFLCSRGCYLKARREFTLNVRVEEFLNASPAPEAAYAVTLVHTPTGLVVSEAGKLSNRYQIHGDAWIHLEQLVVKKYKEPGNEE